MLAFEAAYAYECLQNHGLFLTWCKKMSAKETLS